MRIKLQVCDEDQCAKSVVLEGPQIKIGRSRDCDIRLAHKSVSRHHGQIELDDNNDFMLQDAESINGLLLNDRNVKRPRRLRPGDEIRIGSTTIVVVEIESDAPAQPPPVPYDPDDIDTEDFLSPLHTHPTPPRMSHPTPPRPSRQTEERSTQSDESEEGPKVDGTLRAMGSAQSWSHCYRRAMESLQSDADRMWKAIKSRTPPNLVGEMNALHESVQAGLSRLERVAAGIEESNERLGKLLEVARIISAPQPLRERLETILDMAISQMNADCGFLMLYSRRNRSLKVALERGMADLKMGLNIGEGDPAANKPSIGIAREAMKSGISVFGPTDPDEEESFLPALASQGIHAAICAPMKVESRFLGLLYVDFRDPTRLSQRPLGPEDTDWFDSLGSLSALAIENARLIQKTRRRKSAK